MSEENWERLNNRLDRVDFQIDAIRSDLRRIIGLLMRHTWPTGFAVNEQNTNQGETTMADTRKFAASIDFQENVNGTATLTATPIPAGSKLPAGVVASWGVNPDGTPAGGLQVVADLTKDPQGLVAIATGVAAEIGAVPQISATLPDGSVIIGTGVPIDVVANAQSPTGFSVAEQ